MPVQYATLHPTQSHTLWKTATIHIHTLANNTSYNPYDPIGKPGPGHGLPLGLEATWPGTLRNFNNPTTPRSSTHLLNSRKPGGGANASISQREIIHTAVM